MEQGAVAPPASSDDSSEEEEMSLLLLDDIVDLEPIAEVESVVREDDLKLFRASVKP